MRSRGFTLIETMVAGAVLAIALSALVLVLGSSATSMGHHRRMTQALALGEQVTEELLAVYNTDPWVEVDTTHSRGFDERGDPNGTATGHYTVVWVVSAHPTVSGVVELDVRVVWDERSGRRSIRWQTYR